MTYNETEQPEADTARTWKRWERELNAAEAHEKTWKERARKIVKRYRDEREANQKNASRFNILFSNTEVLRGAIYQRTPAPEVRRRYGDKDPVGKIGAEILKRCLAYSIDSYDFDDTLKSAVSDSLLPGRGVARVRYVPQMQVVDGVEQVVSEEVRCDHHDWEFFRYSPAKRWDKVRWVAFGELLTRDDLKAQFSAVGELVKLDWSPDGASKDDESEIVKRALVWTIWNKADRKVYVWAAGYNVACLAVVDDPLGLQGFFPCPRPLYAVSTTDSLIPVPDYTQYEDQALELDELTGRRTALMDALRYRGVYDQSVPELAKLAAAGDGTFIPVENIAALIEKGGLDKTFSALPIKDLAAVVLQLTEQAEALKQSIYEITGISDIFRGASEAEETARAQEIKAQYGGIRIRNRQQEVQRFARDLLRLKAEVMAEHFDPQTLMQMSGTSLPSTQDKQIAQMALAEAQRMQREPDPAAVAALEQPAMEEVMQVIANDRLRGFRIDIETDSTLQPDQQAEQESRIEALTAFSDMIEKVVPAVQLGIMPMEMAQESIGWVLRSFKNPGKLEEVVEKMGEQPPPQGPSPEQVAELEKREQEVQKGMQKLQQGGMALEGERVKLDAERSAFGSEVKTQMEKISAFTDAALERISGAVDALKMRQQAAKANKPRPSA